MDRTNRYGISIQWNTRAPRNGRRNGARIRDVLDVVIDRLHYAQQVAPCPEHSEVLRLLEQARVIHVERVSRADSEAACFERALLG